MPKPKPPLEILKLPLPPKVIHPNGRTRNYRYRAAMAGQARYWSYLMAAPSRPKAPYEKLTVQAVFHLKRAQDGDNLNAWIKNYLDGLQDAGWIVNDSGITLLPAIQVTGKAAGLPGVKLELYAA